MAQWRWIWTAAVSLLLLIGAPAFAADGLVPTNCFTVSDRAAVSSPANCTANPTGYHGRWLWLHAPAPDGREWRATVRQSRFDALVVVFRYADGVEKRESGAAGDFGRHWRVGGKLAFDPPLRHAALTSVSFGFRNLASHELLRVRMPPTHLVDRAETVATLIAGAAMALLAFAAIYNIGVGAGSRRRPVLWHAAWAACVLGWGLLWTQVILFAAPMLAGPATVQGSIFLATCAIGCAGQFFVTSIERDMLPRWFAALLTAIAATVALLGAFAAVGPRELMWLAEDLLGVTVLASAVTLVGAIVVAVRRGSRMARDFAMSWAVPVLADDLLPRLTVSEGPLDSRVLFGDDRPLWLEIGFGAGEHLAGQAEANPDVGWSGPSSATAASPPTTTAAS